MACNWTYDSKGNINGAKTENGKPSPLFKELENKFGTEQAIEMYAVSQSDDFKQLLGENQESLIYDMEYSQEEEAWEVFLVDGGSIPVYLDETATPEEVRTEALKVIKEYKIEELPTVFRGINGEFKSGFEGTQYFAVDKDYARVFGRNIEEFRLQTDEILDLDAFNKRWGTEKIDIGQGLVTVGSQMLDNLKMWEEMVFIGLLNAGYSKQEAEREASLFIFQAEKARVIKGEDIGNKGRVVFAVKDKNLIQPINKQIQFQKQVNEAVSDAPNEAVVTEVLNKLLETDLANNVYYVTGEEIQTALERLGATEGKKVEGVNYITTGFIYGKDVYINKDRATTEVAIHEFNHLYTDWLKENKPQIYKKGISLVRDKANAKALKEIIKSVKTTQPNLEPNSEAFYEEVLTEAVGRKGAEILNKYPDSSIGKWLQEFWDAIKGMLGLSQFTTKEVLYMNLNQYIEASAVDLLSGKTLTINDNTTESRPIKPFSEPYPLSFVKPSDIIDFKALLKDIQDKGQKVYFWMGDQLGIGEYTGSVTGVTHYLDAGLSYALDPINRDRGVIWATGLAVTGKSVEKMMESDYIFIISGAPDKAKLFNTNVQKIFTDRIKDFQKFKKDILKVSAVKEINDYLQGKESFSDFKKAEMKKFIIALRGVEKTKTPLKDVVEKYGLFLDLNDLRDGFLKANDVKSNDVMIVLKPKAVGGESSHSTYNTEILGEVVGVPDIIVDSYSIIDENIRNKYRNDITESQKTKITAGETGTPHKIGSDVKFKKIEAKTVVDYLVAQNANKEPITKEQKLDVMNFLIGVQVETAQELLGKLEDTFYVDGLFFVNKDKLVQSGLYTRYEAEVLFKDLEMQAQVKNTIEQLKNTEGLEDIVSENFTTTEKLDEFTSLGKLRVENPYLKELEGQKTARKFVEVDGQIREAVTEDLEVVMPLVVKEDLNTELLANIATVLDTSDEVIEANEELLNKVYSKIEDLTIAQGIDVLGTQFNKENLTALYNFVAVPSKENMTTLINLLDKNTTPKEVVVKDNTDLNLIELNTTLSDKEVFESTGLLKMRDNLYVQTNQQPLEEMYNNLFLHKDKIPQNIKTIEEFQTYIQSKMTPQTTEEMELFKMFYGEQQNQKQEEIKAIAEVSEYLTTDFVSDFYIQSLKEKKKDSPLYNNFYKHFEVNENGLNLINQDPITIAQIKEYADENLLNYSLISKQMPALKESEEILEERFTAANYPQTVENITEKVYSVGSSYIVKGETPQFTKINGEVYEAVSRVGQLALYEKLPSVKKDYNQKVEKPEPSLNLAEYKNLETMPEKFKTTKNYLTKEEKQIAEQDFIC